MKTLSIMRHAHAEKHAEDGTDFARRLDKRGLREAVEIGDWAKRLGLSPERLLASPATRTKMTAAALADALNLSPSQVTLDRRIYDAARPALLALLTELPSHQQHVLLVGHNPGVSKLVRWLADDEAIDEFSPATLLTLNCEIDEWPELTRGAATVIRRLMPTER
jgi:phosphohistidine phosphatase